jgi:hypothetical protein
MAAISHVFTIRRAAQILGRDEDLKTCYGSCPTSSSPKTGSCGFNPRFTHDGIEALREIIKDSRRLIPRRVYRGAQRMLTRNPTLPTNHRWPTASRSLATALWMARSLASCSAVLHHYQGPDLIPDAFPLLCP